MIALLALIGCGVSDDWEPPEYPAVTAGAPMVGAAESFLRLPAGTPLAGFTARCRCLIGIGAQDSRESVYTQAFVESTGVHTHPGIKVIWVDNGDDHLVITKTDAIYSADNLVAAIEAQLSERTGLDLAGKVVHTVNHSHSAYGDFSEAVWLNLGTDQYNEEVFQRFVSQVVDVAVQAHDGRQPAKVGMSITRDWDPDNQVFSDRRGENNDVVILDPPLPTGKDPDLVVMRFDALDDTPIAVMVNFGMHGIVLDESNSMISSDSGGGVETYFSEAFDEPVVVMYTQGSGGDQSPRGEQEDFARIESIGERATPALLEAWENTPTSDAPITLQTASRAIPTHTSLIEVTRQGEVDWRYAPFGTQPDNQVYDENGGLMSPVDEFATETGALFCGNGDFDVSFLPGAPLPGVSVFPYDGCVRIEAVLPLIRNYFDIDPTAYGLAEDDEFGVPLPLPSMRRANTLASVVSGLTVRDADGSTAESDVVFGFFPGESTHMYTEQWRRRATAELGVDHAVMVSYAMDHEGYLLIPEDWLLGGYEPVIGYWGPLGGEYVMEEVLEYSDELLLDDVHQPSDPLGQYLRTQYPVRQLPTLAPDVTPEAGTIVTTVPDTFWVPNGFAVDLDIPATVPRVQGTVQLAWQGGDPGVDDPMIILERQVGGNWEAVTTRSGRAINDSHHDILKAHTPDPLEPVDALQEHYWWAGWQAVGHVHDRAGLPLGTYRLRVEGNSFDGAATTWPWGEVPYSLTSDPFEVVPAVIDVEEVTDGVLVSLPGPASGYRYIAAGGSFNGDNPVEGELTVRFEPSGEEQVVTGTLQGNRSHLAVTVPVDATSIVVTDAYGNSGTLTR